MENTWKEAHVLLFSSWFRRIKSHAKLKAEEEEEEVKDGCCKKGVPQFYKFH